MAINRKRKPRAKTKRPNKPKQAKKKWFIRDERFAFIMGLLTIFAAGYFFLAFFSYLLTWQTDQSNLDLERIGFVADSGIVVENWAGKLGAVLSSLFIHDWFGISSFAIVFILIVAGFRMMRIRLVPFRTSLQYTILGGIWLSLFLGYFFGNSFFLLGGGHGFFMSQWLNSAIGKAGTAFVLIILLLAYIVYAFAGAWPWISYQLLKLFNKDIKIPTVIALPEHVFTIEDIEEEKDDSGTKGSEIEILPTLSTVDDVTEKPNNDLNEKPITDEAEIIKEEDKKTEEPGFEIEVLPDDPEEGEIKTTEPNIYDPTLELSKYTFPSLELLETYDGMQPKVSEEELVENKDKIINILQNYSIKIDSIKATVGPTITLYEIVPSPGVRISKIKNLEDDIALSLAALGIRIIAPIPGKGTIGIEVPNKKPRIVSMRSVLSSKEFQESKYELPIAMGKTISNDTYTFDLAKMPHLLVAGATGQGKSVGLNAIICSLLYKKHPSQLKFVLIDPKKVELALFSKINKHYLAQLPDEEEPIIIDTQKVVHTLNSLTRLMDTRYDLLKNALTRNIKEYNQKFTERKLNPEKGHHYMPYIVVVVDEFADLIMTAGKEIEMPLARIAQLARAIGIHLVIATQRPSTNVITGSIKANFPARIAFRVASMVDSKTILDQSGANRLVGKGDMLITSGADPVRLQCAFIDTPEIDQITNHIGNQQAYPTPFYLPEYVAEESETGGVDIGQRDTLFPEAARILVVNQQGSTSLIQRKLSIGFNRAGRIIDQLEAAGIVGPSEGSKARKVLYTDLESLEQFLRSIE